ncbi:uncharacterized protein EI90DRAFT_3041650 [Cantharellus anzutake]|uniref:uncharacterized protein n=1 Tax=Cantharellus anzutake TaxID=1750568 RepID=UPI00190758CB|nr:uncharacterized protein EI90DRAFT_3041650 [Cantharellus anzutake]KAF8338107.1 hypothetical protein EI90DRAFT_3041650 [Cantharellus anzutake]
MYCFSLGPISLRLSSSSLVLVGAWYTIFATSSVWSGALIRLPKWVFILLLLAPFLMAVIHGRIPHLRRTPEGELYGGFHLPLNMLPGREYGPPETEWLNMGYWENTTIFPEACEALALRVASMACVHSGHVLEVGFGCGDSLLLQLRHPSIPRPVTITGITSLPSHFHRAKQRIEQADLKEKIPTRLFLGDAVFREGTNPSSLTAEQEATVSIMESHPLRYPGNETLYFDSILGVDCAYHFKTRNLFLRQCYDRLTPGSGRLALADMCFEPTSSTPLTYLSKIIAFILRVPSANLIGRRAYRESLEKIGFDEIVIEDISSSVYSGFTAFLRTRGIMWVLFANIITIWHKGGGKFVLVSARRS